MEMRKAIFQRSERVEKSMEKIECDKTITNVIRARLRERDGSFVCSGFGERISDEMLISDRFVCR